MCLSHCDDNYAREKETNDYVCHNVALGYVHHFAIFMNPNVGFCHIAMFSKGIIGL